MNWRDLINEVATTTGLPKSRVREVLEETVDLVNAKMTEGEEVSIRGLGVFGFRWRAARALQSVSDNQRIVMDGRYVARFRPAQRLRDSLVSRTPQQWREPARQEAFREAEALLVDLRTRHNGHCPAFAFAEDTSDEDVLSELARSFGGDWRKLVTRFEAKVDESLEEERYSWLALAARKQWPEEEHA